MVGSLKIYIMQSKNDKKEECWDVRLWILTVFEHISHLLISCSSLMSALVLQAVLRETEAVAYCH